MCKLAKYVRNCVVFWKILHSWQKFYTTAGRGGRDKFQVWLYIPLHCRRYVEKSIIALRFITYDKKQNHSNSVGIETGQMFDQWSRYTDKGWWEKPLIYSVINLKIKSKWGWGGTIGNKTMMKILPHFRSLPLYVRIVTTTSNLVMPPHNIKLIHTHIPWYTLINAIMDPNRAGAVFQKTKGKTKL